MLAMCGLVSIITGSQNFHPIVPSERMLRRGAYNKSYLAGCSQLNFNASVKFFFSDLVKRYRFGNMVPLYVIDTYQF